MPPAQPSSFARAATCSISCALFALTCLLLPRSTSAEDEQTEVVEATSLLGTPLVRPTLPADAVARHQAALDAALERAREREPAQPGDPDALVWAGRRLGYLGRYREAIETFSAGVERFPDDARFLRHRGHRKISVRDLEGAIDDLEAGVALAAGRPDLVEPDGLPNLYNRPTGTLKSNLWYHLGLARYLRGDFARAAEAYVACAALADNPDLHVAASYWLVLSYRRLGRHDDAAAALEATFLHAPLLENDGYQDLLRLFALGPSSDAARTTAAELLARDAPGSLGAVTTAYGVGAWHLLAGRDAEAFAIFEQVVTGEGWAAFGFVAAEAELARRKR